MLLSKPMCHDSRNLGMSDHGLTLFSNCLMVALGARVAVIYVRLCASDAEWALLTIYI